MSTGPATIELERYQERLWQVRVDVAGRPCRFLFDVGAGITSLDARVADELGLREVGRVAAFRMTGSRLELGVLPRTHLALAGRSLGSRPLGRTDFSRILPPGWPPVDGILALDALVDVPFTVDFARDTMTLGPPLDTSGLRPLTVRPYRQVPSLSLVILVAVECPAEDLWFELDNSNVGPIVIAPKAAARLGIPRTTEPRMREIRVRGLGPISCPVLVRDLIYDGNLGNLFASPRRFAFDLAADRVLAGTSTAPRQG